MRHDLLAEQPDRAHRGFVREIAPLERAHEVVRARIQVFLHVTPDRIRGSGEGDAAQPGRVRTGRLGVEPFELRVDIPPELAVGEMFGPRAGKPEMRGGFALELEGGARKCA